MVNHQGQSAADRDIGEDNEQEDAYNNSVDELSVIESGDDDNDHDTDHGSDDNDYVNYGNDSDAYEDHATGGGIDYTGDKADIQRSTLLGQKRQRTAKSRPSNDNREKDGDTRGHSQSSTKKSPVGKRSAQKTSSNHRNKRARVGLDEQKSMCGDEDTYVETPIRARSHGHTLKADDGVLDQVTKSTGGDQLLDPWEFESLLQPISSSVAPSSLSSTPPSSIASSPSSTSTITSKKKKGEKIPVTPTPKKKRLMQLYSSPDLMSGD